MQSNSFSLGNSSIATYLQNYVLFPFFSPCLFLLYYNFVFSLTEIETKYYKSRLAFPKVTFRTLVPWEKSWKKDSVGEEFWENAAYLNSIFKHPGAISRSKDLKSLIRKKALQFYLIQHFPDLFDHGHFFFFSSNICALRNIVFWVSGEKRDYPIWNMTDLVSSSGFHQNVEFLFSSLLYALHGRKWICLFCSFLESLPKSCSTWQWVIPAPRELNRSQPRESTKDEVPKD